MDNIFNIYNDYTICALTDGRESAEKELAEFAMTYGISGNVIRCYIAYKLALDENAFSLACEFSPLPRGSIFPLAQKDLGKIFDLYFTPAKSGMGMVYKTFFAWQGGKANKYVKSASDVIKALTANLDKCKNTQEFTAKLAKFYAKRGSGEFALNLAFGLDQDGQLNPIALGKGRKLSELIGLTAQKEALTDNTCALMEGRRANNVLLYGDGGTGKTTSVKAMLSDFGDDGLRIIEIYKHQFKFIPKVIEQIKKRKYKFILFMDDLSFEESETEYKYLKALIDGGLATMPDNVVVYATSNRRHIIKESWKDRSDSDDDLHRYDTVEEKLSLVKRFGLTLYFPSPDQKEYLNIVRSLAKRAKLDIDDELERAALRWEMREGGKSGRSAEQFINNILSANKR